MRLLLPLALGIALALPAAANDSSAELAAGGLVLTKTAAVEMRSEDLFVSMDEVRVDYVFRNVTDKDVVLRVAFPMPDITVGPMDNISIPTEDPVNILAFATSVDSKAVKAVPVQRAMVGERDWASELKRLGVPLALHLPGVVEALDRLDPADKARLEQAGAVTVEEYDDTGNGMREHLVPMWSLQTTWHWQQSFPAGRDLKVSHRYRPSVGQSAGTGILAPEERQRYVDNYCTDASFLAGARKRLKPGMGVWELPLNEHRIAYILKTGANWAGPIGDFTLTIDKGAAENLVSFCAEGVEKISPTQFRVTKKNYTPTEDLQVLILAPLE